jgi:hypothetical protein
MGQLRTLTSTRCRQEMNLQDGVFPCSLWLALILQHCQYSSRQILTRTGPKLTCTVFSLILSWQMVWATYFGCYRLVHHRDKVLAFKPDYIAQTSISIFWDPSKMELTINSVKVIHAWDSNPHLIRIPPNVRELIDLHKLKVEQSQLVELIHKKVMNGLTKYFDVQQMGGGEMRNDQSSDEGDDCNRVPRKC